MTTGIAGNEERGEHPSRVFALSLAQKKKTKSFTIHLTSYAKA